MISAPRSQLTLQQPPKITIGPGSTLSAINELTRSSPARTLIVTSPSVREAAEKIATILRTTGGRVEILTGIPPEPTVTCCEQLRAQARLFAPDLVIAIGGGSVLDVAKLVAAIHDRAEHVKTFFGIGLLSDRRTRLVCIPTTAGTGSEVSPNALLFDEVSSSKKAVISPALVPDEAIIDAELMISLPPDLTATTGIDALAHCIEAYTNKTAHPHLDLYALEGVRLIGANLAAAVANGHDVSARAAVALGSLYGGLCLGPVNTAGVHALAYPLGGEFHIAHGLSIALLLPHVVRFNSVTAPERHATLAHALGVAPKNNGGYPIVLARALPDALETLISQCGIVSGLSRHGISSDALPRMADSALQVTRLLINNPRAITRDDAIRIYQAAY